MKVKEHVLSIIDDIENGLDINDYEEAKQEEREPNGFDYIRDALDIEYIIGSDGDYRGARVLVSFGGPNIWINTKRSVVEGYWWGDNCEFSYTDNIGLNDAVEELFECTR